MVINTSAVLAVLLGEAEAEQFAKAIAADHKRLMSTFSALETGIVIEARKGPAGAREWDVLLHQAAIDIIPFTSRSIHSGAGGMEKVWQRKTCCCFKHR